MSCLQFCSENNTFIQTWNMTSVVTFKICSDKNLQYWLFVDFSDTSNSGRFCEARNLTLECRDLTQDDGTTKSEITVGFDVLLKNKDDGAIHTSCVDRKFLHALNSIHRIRNIKLPSAAVNRKKPLWTFNLWFPECKRQNLRGMLGNAINLTKEMEELLQDKAIGIDTGNGNPTPVTNTGVDRNQTQNVLHNTRQGTHQNFSLWSVLSLFL